MLVHRYTSISNMLGGEIFEYTIDQPSASSNVLISSISNNLNFVSLLLVGELDCKSPSIFILTVVFFRNPFYPQISLSKASFPKHGHSLRVVGTVTSIHGINSLAYHFISLVIVFLLFVYNHIMLECLGIALKLLALSIFIYMTLYPLSPDLL